GDAEKADAAETAVGQGGTISVQVLNEFAHVARRKLGMSWEELSSFLGTIRALVDVVPLTAAIHDRGLQLAERYRLSIYDAMIAAAALAGECDILLSEDLQHGMSIEGLIVVNPFRGSV
ncbi:MAG TPA: PIN domain-containing protein, partial [Pseudorhizobium sp.]|nr:PIN domain-containing protein [Pseudorhizobium sp.]